MIVLAACRLGCDAAVDLIDRDNFLRRIEPDQIGFARGFEQDAVQIGAMNEGIRMMKFFAERSAERNAGDFLAGDRIQHHQIFRKYRKRADRFDEPKLFEHPEYVRPKLNAGADFLELGRLLDDLRWNALARERQSRGQPANAAADDQGLRVFPGGHSKFFTCENSPSPGGGGSAVSKIRTGWGDVVGREVTPSRSLRSRPPPSRGR